MFEALLDPTKKIKANDTVIFTTSTGAVIVGTYFGTTGSKVIVQVPRFDSEPSSNERWQVCDESIFLSASS